MGVRDPAYVAWTKELGFIVSQCLNGCMRYETDFRNVFEIWFNSSRVSDDDKLAAMKNALKNFEGLLQSLEAETDETDYAKKTDDALNDFIQVTAFHTI